MVMVMLVKKLLRSWKKLILNLKKITILISLNLLILHKN